MPGLKHRSYTKELLDATGIPYEDIILNMQELNTINTYLGGHHITLQGFKKLAGSQKNISVAEIGCGGGDNLRAIEKYCTENRIALDMCGIDVNADIASFALKQNPKLNMICRDYREVKLDAKPDIIFSSLFCHHFTEEELVTQLLWMKENSGIGFFINDLHRHPLAYYSIKLLTSCFSKSYLVKNDAPLSVARGFIRNEWEAIFDKAGIRHHTIYWKWAFRHLIIFEHGKQNF